MNIDPIGLLVYAIMVRAFGVYNLSIKFSALIVGVAPLVIAKLINFISLRIYDLPLRQLLAPSDIVITLLQLVVAFFVFYMLRQRDDDLAAWFAIFIVGASVNYMLIPYLVPIFVPR